MIVENLKLWRLTVNKQSGIQTERRQLLIVGNVLPPVAKILGRERMTVRPSMPFAQAQSKHPILNHIDTLENVRL